LTQTFAHIRIEFDEHAPAISRVGLANYQALLYK